MADITFRIHATHSASSRLRRSLALAAGFRESDPSCGVRFLLSGAESACAAVQSHGHQCAYLGDGKFPSWNLEATESALAGCMPDMLVVDDTNIDTRFLTSLAGKTYIALMDDNASLPSYAPGAIVNPNINAHTQAYSGESAELLLGTEFAALQPEFDEYQEFGRENPELARRILVNFPGPDPEGSTIAVARMLKSIDGKFLAEVLLSEDFAHGEALAREVGLDDRFLIINGGAGRARHMASADLAICPPGQAFHEAILFSLPCALVFGDGAPAGIGEYAGMNGFAAYLGEASGFGPQAASQLHSLIHGKALRDRMSARVSGLVDGLGRFRLADELLRLYGAR